MPIAERAALAAIRADSEDPWAHHALGHVYLFARRFEDSLAEFEVALRLNPNFALAQAFYGLSLSYSGRWQEADEAARRALRLSPRDPYSAVYTGIAAYAQFLGAQLRGGDAPVARVAAPAQRFRRRASRAHRGRRHGRRRPRSPRPRCRSAAARSRTSRSPGSPSICRSSRTPTASTISKDSAAPAWTDGAADSALKKSALRLVIDSMLAAA